VIKGLVSCLCATYGRFSFLREAVACFLAQDYSNKELLILNNHPEPIICDLPGVKLFNRPGFPNLGACRNWLLEQARGEFIRTWDDDDLYLPWTLRQGAANINGAPAFKPSHSWGCQWCLKRFDLEDNTFEAAILIRTEVAQQNGYKESGGDEHEPLLNGIDKAGGCRRVSVSWDASYVYRWDNELWRISGSLGTGTVEARTAEWERQNQDTGGGEPLEPTNLMPCWDALLADAPRTLDPPGVSHLKEALRGY
jgi:glycosyltransferase involved in cell wall biosynthesis